MNKLQTSQQTHFLSYIHYFRGIAILFIVGIHVYASLNWENSNHYIHHILRVLLDDSTLLFVFISGFLFQHLSYKFQTRVYLKKKFKFVFQPYLIFSMPIIIGRLAIDKAPRHLLAEIPDFSEWHEILQVLFYLITGSHLRPYWFIPMLAFFYISAPLLIRLDRYKLTYQLVLPFLLVTSFFIGRGNGFQIIQNFIHFLPIYLLGMLVSKHKKILFHILNKWRSALYLLGMLSFLLAYLYPSGKTFYIQKIVFIFCLLLLLKENSAGLKEHTAKIFDKIAVYSFGVYFVHDYFDVGYKFLLLKLMGIQRLPGSIAMWCLIFVLILGASLLTLKTLRVLLNRSTSNTKQKSRKIIGC